MTEPEEVLFSNPSSMVDVVGLFIDWFLRHESLQNLGCPQCSNKPMVIGGLTRSNWVGLEIQGPCPRTPRDKMTPVQAGQPWGARHAA